MSAPVSYHTRHSAGRLSAGEHVMVGARTCLSGGERRLLRIARSLAGSTIAAARAQVAISKRLGRPVSKVVEKIANVR